MHHEIAVFGVLFPSLLPCALVAGLVWFVLDAAMLRAGAWSLVYHAALARLSLYVVLLGVVAAVWPDP